MEETKGTEPVIEGNQDDVRILLDEIATLLTWFNRSANLESTTMNPYNDRLLLGRLIVSLPYV